MIKVFQLVLAFIVATGTTFSQEEDVIEKHYLYADLITGPYLMIDHHLYKSVFMKGTRLGYHVNSRVSLGLEYMVGQQDDRTGVSGTTHTANGQVYYYLTDRLVPRKISFYLLIGGGFFEFKDFSKDVYGLAYHGGAGFNFPIFDRIQGFMEGRYINLGPLNLEGKNEIGVLWGLRVNF
jgi:hypothetical protein